MAFEEIWINNSTGNDTTGDGSSGSPYASFQGALDHGAMTTDGRAIFAVRTGTAYSGASNRDLNFTTSGNPSSTQPLWFIGVENTSKDKPTSLVEVDAETGHFLNQATAGDYCTFINLSIHNDGTNEIVDLDNNCVMVNCEFYFDVSDPGNGNVIVQFDASCGMFGCYVHDVNAQAVSAVSNNLFWRCMFTEETGSFGTHETGNGVAMVDCSNGCNVFVDCAFYMDSAGAVGIDNAINNWIIGCGFINTTGCTQEAIDVSQGDVVMNCVFEGFNGTGGSYLGIGAGRPMAATQGLWLRNCNAALDDPSPWLKDVTTVTTASPFTGGAKGSFDFTPVSINSGANDETTYPAKVGGQAAP